jgi:phosphatidylglycerol:prolipoprotein diacylglycerol transferase
MLLAQAWIHDLSPFLVEFSDGVGLRWYGLSYIAGFGVGWLLLRWLAGSARTPLRPEMVGDLLLSCVVGVLVGGRLGYVAFYDPSLLWTFDAGPPWWGLLAIHKGGMASHGGLVGVAVAGWIFARRWGLHPRHAFDALAVAAPPGLCFGRTANFINGELWGRPMAAAAQADPPWFAIKYPEELLRAPIEVQRAALESLGPLASGTEPIVNAVTAVYAGGAEGAEVAERIAPYLTAYWPSQVFQATAEGPILLTAVLIAWFWPRRHAGTVGATWLLVYGVLRIVTEQFRQPDEGVALLLGLSRGQVLSVLMVVAGATLLWRWSRRDVPTPPEATPGAPASPTSPAA